MSNSQQYYQPPESHESQIKKTGIWLTVFFFKLAILILLVIIYSQELSKFLPFSAEKRFTQPYEQLISHYFNEDHSQHGLVISTYLTELGSRLAHTMEVPEDYSVQFHFINSPSVNAFATLGGHIFVSRGLMNKMPDENSLAFVIAHELAHIKHRDPVASIGRGLALQMLYSFISGDYSNSDLALEGGEIGLLYFSREQEQMADTAAVQALYTSYQHAGGFDSLFRQLINHEQGRKITREEYHQWREWLSTHPTLDKRITDMLMIIQEKNYNSDGQRTPIPNYVKLSLNSLKNKQDSRGNEADSGLKKL